MTKSSAPRQDIYTRITDQIVADLEQGVRALDEALERRACRRAHHAAAAA